MYRAGRGVARDKKRPHCGLFFSTILDLVTDCGVEIRTRDTEEIRGSTEKE